MITVSYKAKFSTMKVWSFVIFISKTFILFSFKPSFHIVVSFFCLVFCNCFTLWPVFFTGASTIYAGKGKLDTLLFTLRCINLAVRTIRPQFYPVRPLQSSWKLFSVLLQQIVSRSIFSIIITVYHHLHSSNLKKTVKQSNHWRQHLFPGVVVSKFMRRKKSK